MIAAVSTVVEAPVEKVWPLLADFSAWHHWLPGIVATTMEGDDLRILQREDGSIIRERLLVKDTVRRTMAYEFDGDHPFPVRRYVGTVRVEPVTTDGTTYIHWFADFDAAAGVDAAAEQAVGETFTRIYQAFFGALRASCV